MRQIPTESNKKMFAQLETEIEQTEKNTGQGVLGRQLGLTKVVSMKLHMHELEKNLKSQINSVATEVKDGDYIKMAQVQEKELTALQNEARNIQRYIPKIEKLEQDLELLEKTETDEEGKPTKPAPKDEELMAIVPEINKLVQTTRKSLKTKQEE